MDIAEIRKKAKAQEKKANREKLEMPAENMPQQEPVVAELPPASERTEGQEEQLSAGALVAVRHPMALIGCLLSVTNSPWPRRQTMLTPWPAAGATASAKAGNILDSSWPMKSMGWTSRELAR